MYLSRDKKINKDKVIRKKSKNKRKKTSFLLKTLSSINKFKTKLSNQKNKQFFPYYIPHKSTFTLSCIKNLIVQIILMTFKTRIPLFKYY